MGYKKKNYAFVLVRDTGLTLYGQWINLDEGQLWDDNAAALSASTTWVNSKVAISELGVGRHYLVSIPKDLQDGRWHFNVFIQAGADPASTDEYDSGQEGLIMAGAWCRKAMA